VKFLANCCGVPPGQAMLLRGETGRNKRVRIDNPQHLPSSVGKPGV
jgi:uncharacterized protein YggU (UPF0235/DUF167 family)